MLDFIKKILVLTYIWIVITVYLAFWLWVFITLVKITITVVRIGPKEALVQARLTLANAWVKSKDIWAKLTRKGMATA